MWERSYVAVSVLLAESGPRSGATALEDALAALEPPSEDAQLVALLTQLRSARRAVRAQGLAVVAQEVALAIGEMTLR